MILIDAQGVKASRPNRPLFADLSITVSDGDRIGVVGLNGCGKSTLLRIISGDLEPDAGVVRKGRGARIGVLPQLPVLPVGTVREAVGHDWQGEAMLDRLGMSGLIDASTAELSGGQKKRVALAALLVSEWEALILDEPTNHLDLDAISYLEEWLANYSGGLLLVTHDRHVLDHVTNKVLEIDRGHSYMHIPANRHAGSGYAAYLAGRIEREEQAATDTPARAGELGLSLGSQRLGSKGIQLHSVGFSWPATSQNPNGALVLQPFEHELEPGDRLGIVGPNGAGKSTLLDLIAQRLHPTIGHIEMGRTVKVGYYDQLGRDLNLNQRVREAVAGDKGAPSVEDNNLMRQFWFDGDAQFAPISTLSGGERRRLQLLLTLAEQPNVLLLDEPTNDLDLDTLRALEEYLDTWPGIVVVVSHDRIFLDRTVNEVLAIDSAGDAALVRGGVQGWLNQRKTPKQSTKVRSAASVSSNDVPTPAPRVTVTAKSASTLRRLLVQAEKSLADATTQLESLTASVATAGADHALLARLSAELAVAQIQMDTAEESWLALAAQAELQGVSIK